MTYSISLTRTLLGVAACVSFASAFGAGSITINNVGCTLSQLTVDSSGNATATISGCTIAFLLWAKHCRPPTRMRLAL